MNDSPDGTAIHPILIEPDGRFSRIIRIRIEQSALSEVKAWARIREQRSNHAGWLRGAGAGILLLAATILWENTTPAAASGPSTVEAAPSVKAAFDGVLDLFRKNSVVALGDAHGLAQEEAFYSALVRDPRFAEEVGNVVVEFGGESSQDIIDRYVAGEDVPLTQLRRVWTETIGWIPGPISFPFDPSKSGPGLSFHNVARLPFTSLSPMAFSSHDLASWTITALSGIARGYKRPRAACKKPLVHFWHSGLGGGPRKSQAAPPLRP